MLATLFSATTSGRQKCPLVKFGDRALAQKKPQKTAKPYPLIKIDLTTADYSRDGTHLDARATPPKEVRG